MLRKRVTDEIELDKIFCRRYVNGRNFCEVRPAKFMVLIFANSGFLNFARFIFANIWMNRILRVLFSYL